MATKKNTDATAAHEPPSPYARSGMLQTRTSGTAGQADLAGSASDPRLHIHPAPSRVRLIRGLRILFRRVAGTVLLSVRISPGPEGPSAPWDPRQRCPGPAAP